MRCPDCQDAMDRQDDLVWDARAGRLVPGPSVWYCAACESTFEEHGSRLVRLDGPIPLDVAFARRRCP